ncbi:MAG: class I SAM-dependent methyltransferase [Gemmatimonadetes bacterium]|nr:class I SAM-dependent methyltransferase [Gemmatimonadota bacterium]
MPPATKPFWEEAYRADSRPFGPPSLEILELLDRLPRRARVLDLGCGDGRNAIPLARAGHRVTAVDRSRCALAALRRAAVRAGSSVEDEEPLVIEIVEAELSTICPLDDYDLVIAHGVLHLLPPRDRDALVERMKKHTRPGGWNVIAAFTNRIPPPPDIAPLCQGLLEEEDLLLRYGDWEIDSFRSYTLEDRHPGGIIHTHPINKLVARRPAPAL